MPITPLHAVAAAAFPGASADAASLPALLCHLGRLNGYTFVSFANANGTENPDMSIDHSTTRTSQPSFIQRLRDGAEAARRATAEDPWESVLRNLQGKVAGDGIE